MTAVGIDVGKAVLDVAIEGTCKVAWFANGAVGIRKLIKRLKAVEEPRIAKELSLAPFSVRNTTLTRVLGARL